MITIDNSYSTLRRYDIIGRVLLVVRVANRKQIEWKAIVAFLSLWSLCWQLAATKRRLVGDKLFLAFERPFIQRQYVLYIQVWLCVKITKEAGNHHQRKHSSPVLEYFVQQSFACSRPFFSFLVFSWIHTLKARYEGKKKQWSDQVFFYNLCSVFLCLNNCRKRSERSSKNLCLLFPKASSAFSHKYDKNTTLKKQDT